MSASARSSSRRAAGLANGGAGAAPAGAEPKPRKQRSGKPRTRPQGRRKVSPPPAPADRADEAPPPMPVPAGPASFGAACPARPAGAAGVPPPSPGTAAPAAPAPAAAPHAADARYAARVPHQPAPGPTTHALPALPPAPPLQELASLPAPPAPLPPTAAPAAGLQARPAAQGAAACSRAGADGAMDGHSPQRDSFFSTGAPDSARSSFFSTGASGLSPAGHQDVHGKSTPDAVEDALTPSSPQRASTSARSPRTVASAKAELLAALKLMQGAGPETTLSTPGTGTADDAAPVEMPPQPLQQPLPPAEDASDPEMIAPAEDVMAAAPDEELPPLPVPSVRRGIKQGPVPAGLVTSSPPASDEAGGSGPGPAFAQASNDEQAAPVFSALAYEEVDEARLDFWRAVTRETHPAELSRAVRAGIPAQVRGAVWQDLSGSRDVLLASRFDALRLESSEHDKAIERDLARTYPDQSYFQSSSPGQQDLFDVVKAYALYDPEVGYCQGMQFIVGPLLLVMDASQAFCTLVALMQTYGLRGHFAPGMPGLQTRLYQFGRIMEERQPRLYAHLARAGVKPNMYASPWLMTLFCYRFPLAAAYRVLDTVFAQGLDALFGFVLALLAANEAQLLTLDFEDAVLFLKHNIFDCYRLPDAPDVPDDPHRAEGESSPVELRSTWTAERYAVNRFAREAAEAQDQVGDADLSRWAGEYNAMQQEALAPTAELEKLRHETWKLAAKVRELEDNAALQETAHVELAKQVVTATLAKDEVGEQLVRYKTLYAEAALAEAQLSLAPPSRSPRPGGTSNSSAAGSTATVSVQMEKTSTNGSQASTTSAPTATSGASQSTVTTASDRSAGTHAPTVAQSVSATVASWGRWMTRSKSNKSSKAAAVAASTSGAAPDALKKDRGAEDDASHGGDTSRADTLDVSDSASIAGGTSHGTTPPPLPPRRPSPMPPRTEPLPPLPVSAARASDGTGQGPDSPGAGTVTDPADSSVVSVTPSEAEVGADTRRNGSDPHAGTNGVGDGDDWDKTPSASPAPSRPSSPLVPSAEPGPVEITG